MSESVSSIDMGQLLRSNSKLIVITLVLVAAGAFLVAYILYWSINKIAVSKQAYIVPQTKVPIVGTQLTKIPGVITPPASNGKRASMTFWIYVHDIDKYSGSRRHVFHVGDENALFTSSPLVYFSAFNNKLHVMYNPINDPEAPNDSTRFEYLTSKYGITIDYIPIQRWVHVAVVVNETVNGGTISAYLDSELVKVVSTGKRNEVEGTSNLIASVQNLKLDKTGSLFVGGSTSDEVGPGFSGLVSKVSLFNYDMNVADVYNDYRAGPIDNLLARLGLPAYGLQSPIYRIA